MQPSLGSITVGNTNLHADPSLGLPTPPRTNFRCRRLSHRITQCLLCVWRRNSRQARPQENCPNLAPKALPKLPHQLLPALATHVDTVLRLHGRRRNRERTGTGCLQTDGPIRKLPRSQRIGLTSTELHVHGLGRNRRI